MRKIRMLLQVLAIGMLLGCENKLDFDFDPTEVEVQVLDDSGIPLQGAVIKVFDNENDYQEEKNTGNSNRELLRGTSDESGKVTFGADDKIDADKDHYFYVSFRDRTRFIDLDNFSSSYQLSSANTKKGGKTDVKIELSQAKSSYRFYSKDLPESSLPLKIYIDGGNKPVIIDELVDRAPVPGSLLQDGEKLFKFSQGVTPYLVVSQTGCVWLGEIEVGGTEKQDTIGMNSCDAGSMSFWIAEKDKSLLPITVTLSPNDEIGKLTQSSSTEPESCFEENTLSVSRDAGEYSYFATSANGNCTWSGRITLPSAGCVIKQLENCDK